MIRPSRGLAWGLTLLTLSFVVAATVLMVLERAGGGQGVGSALLDSLFAFVPASFCAVGLILALRLPENSIGWLCLTIGLLWSGEAAGYQAAQWAGDNGDLDTAAWVGLASFLWLPAMGLTGMHLALRLPSGSLPSERWRWFSRFCTVAIVIVGVLVVTAPGSVANVAETKNPLGSGPLQSLGPLFLLLPAGVLGSIWSLVTRYRRSSGIERLQIRWIAFGGVVLLAGVLTAIVPLVLGLVDSGTAPDVVEGLFYIALTAVPVAIGIAVLRYRLYEIDSIINRALVYAGLTATLAGAYVGGVLLLGLLLHPLTENSNLAIAGSTLAVAALFRPVRGRIQAAVDHRFFRRRYDAQRTLESFASRLRDQVELGTLSAELSEVVRETLQPAHISLWLREPQSPGG